MRLRFGGSEICISDRCLASQAQKLLNIETVRQGDKPLQEDNPVDYTPLTLPTNKDVVTHVELVLGKNEVSTCELRAGDRHAAIGDHSNALIV